MKIISTKEYNELKKTQSAYLDLLMKPLQGVFEKVTDDDLLRENGLLNAENERLNNIINELEQELVKKLEAVKTIKNTLGEGAYVVNPHIDVLEQEYNYFYKKLQELKGVDKE